MRVDDFDFALPPECIALAPANPRDSARMLVVGAEAGSRIPACANCPTSCARATRWS